MPFHLIAFHDEIDEGGVYTNLPPVTDPTITIAGNYAYCPELNNIIGTYVAGGDTCVGAYVQTPSLRKLLNLDIFPLQQATYPTGGESIFLFPEDPIPLERYEGIEVLVNANPTSAERHTVLLWLSDGAIAKVSGAIYTIRATASITAVAGAWSEGALTFRQTLPVGTYAVVGGVGYGANMVAFRFIPVGYAWRPGGLAVTDRGAFGGYEQRHGRLGVWFTFDARTPPSVEILAVGACTSQEFYIDLIKVA